VALRGGYAGLADPNSPNVRDVGLYETILSGDLAGNDDPNQPFVNYGENSYHIVTSSGTSASAVLDGFTLAHGNAEGAGIGGGVYNNAGGPRLIRCTFRNNYYSAIYDYFGAPYLVNCEFVGNGTPGDGGAVYDNASTPTFVNCVFYGNESGPSGADNRGDRAPAGASCTAPMPVSGASLTALLTPTARRAPARFLR